MQTSARLLSLEAAPAAPPTSVRSSPAHRAIVRLRRTYSKSPTQRRQTRCDPLSMPYPTCSAPPLRDQTNSKECGVGSDVGARARCDSLRHLGCSATRLNLNTSEHYTLSRKQHSCLTFAPHSSPQYCSRPVASSSSFAILVTTTATTYSSSSTRATRHRPAVAMASLHSTGGPASTHNSHWTRAR